jgi:mono/diheme cytochrome c family protein
MTQSFKFSFLIFGSFMMAACSASGPTELHKEPNVELIQDMMESPALKAQDFETFDRTKQGARLPPDGTVPVGYAKYPYHLQPDLGEKNNKNPFNGQMTAEVLDLGRTKFETYCAVCHGYEGKGDGPVSVKMAVKPPPLISDKVSLTYNDGRIFHIISDGQGVMSSYAYQLVNPNDRWAIVNYVRSLQKLARGGTASKSGREKK